VSRRARTGKVFVEGIRCELRDAAAVRVHDEDVEIPVAVTLKRDLASAAIGRGLAELRPLLFGERGWFGSVQAASSAAIARNGVRRDAN